MALAGAGAFYVRHRFTARLDAIAAEIRADKTGLLPRADLPAEVLALAQKLSARSDDLPGVVAFTQSGEMWMAPGAKPTAFTASQIAGVGSAAFLWRAAMNPARAILVADYFVHGRGGLDVKLLGIFPIAHMLGDADMNRGEMLRYLAELPWNPDAILLNPSLDWSVIDPQTLKVATGRGADRAEITFTLNADGLITDARAESRPYADKGRMIPLPWHGRFWAYESIGSRLMPREGEVAWELDGQEFVYWRGKLLIWTR